MNIYIFSKKYSKLDIYKTWKKIFIKYFDSTKYFKIWVFKIYQMLITSKLVINKLKQNTKLFIKYWMSLLIKLFWQSASEPKPEKKPRKKPCIENKVKYNSFIEVKALNESKIRIKNFYNYLI